MIHVAVVVTVLSYIFLVMKDAIAVTDLGTGSAAKKRRAKKIRTMERRTKLPMRNQTQRNLTQRLTSYEPPNYDVHYRPCVVSLALSCCLCICLCTVSGQTRVLIQCKVDRLIHVLLTHSAQMCFSNSVSHLYYYSLIEISSQNTVFIYTNY